MHSSLEQQKIILECGCGEMTVILGSEDYWRSRHPVFKCECGQKLTLDNHADEVLVASS